MAEALLTAHKKHYRTAAKLYLEKFPPADLKGLYDEYCSSLEASN